MVDSSQSEGMERRAHLNCYGKSDYTIFVGNLSYATSDDELRSFFEKTCGDVSTARVVLDKQTSQSRGFGFVQFYTLTGYENALTLNGSSLAGRSLKISPSKSTTVSVAATPPTGEQRTSVVHCKKSNYDVYIGRPSVWGNPFVKGRDGEKSERIAKYRAWIMNQPELMDRAKKELRGRVLGCWCKPEACHGDTLAEIADAD